MFPNADLRVGVCKNSQFLVGPGLKVAKNHKSRTLISTQGVESAKWPLCVGVIEVFKKYTRRGNLRNSQISWEVLKHGYPPRCFYQAWSAYMANLRVCWGMGSENV